MPRPAQRRITPNGGSPGPPVHRAKSATVPRPSIANARRARRTAQRRHVPAAQPGRRRERGRSAGQHGFPPAWWWTTYGW